MPRSGIAVRWVAGAAEISPADWDRLARSSTFYLSHDWVLGMEPLTGLVPSYLVVELGGCPAALLPVYVGERPTNVRYLAPRLLNGLPGLRDGRLVLAGLAAGYHTDLLVDDELDPVSRRDVVDAIVRELRAVTAREDVTA